MQRIWVSKINWDDKLPLDLSKKWDNFSKNIPQLSTLAIPRWLFSPKVIAEIQLHGFSDASLQVYSVCVYVRVIYSESSLSSNLLCSKSRIAPLKTVSLPRLELCGTVLL